MVYTLSWWDCRVWLVGPLEEVSERLAQPADNDFLSGFMHNCVDSVAIVSLDRAMQKTKKPYIQTWRNGGLWLIGPFESIEHAFAWAKDPANGVDNATIDIGFPYWCELERMPLYVLPWLDDPFSLVGPFDSFERAVDWLEEPANQPDNEWRWQATDFSDLAAPVTIVSPLRAEQPTRMFYIVHFRDDPCSLVGPFDTAERALDWARDPVRDPGDLPNWSLIELANPSAPIRIISPHKIDYV